MFLCIITFTAVQYSNVDEWKLCVLVVTKTAKVSVSGVGLGLGLSGLGLPGLDNISGPYNISYFNLDQNFTVNSHVKDLLSRYWQQSNDIRPAY